VVYKKYYSQFDKSFLFYEKIETTTTKAKELRPIIEKLITTAKIKSVHNIRLVNRFIKNKIILKKLFINIAPKYMKRNGGYVNIIKSRVRKGDSASLSIIRLIK
jgi:large subunit ribosomal protein L17